MPLIRQHQMMETRGFELHMKNTLNICVYTALIGDYEQLNEQPIAVRSSLPFICLTDNPQLTSKSWNCRTIEPLFARDHVRSQRELKIRPHLYLPEFSGSIYIDNSVILSEPPEELWKMLGPDADILLPEHSFRETVMEEFLEVSRLGLDDQARIIEQLNHYALTCPEVLQERPWWPAIMVRNHHSIPLQAMLDIWAAHVHRYSRRDQLSVNQSFRQSGVVPAALHIDNHHSWFHRWPKTVGRNHNRGFHNPIVNLIPLAARVRQLETELTQQLEQHESVVTELRSQISALRQSTSWRATAPLRRLVDHFPASTRLIRRGLKLAWESAASGSAIPAGMARSQAGALIHIDPAGGRGRRLIDSGGDLNPATMAIWQLLLAVDAWTHVVDVGANYGEMLVNGGMPQGAQIIAIEPNPQARLYLARTLKRAQVQATIVDLALSDTEGEAALRITSEWSGTTHLSSPGVETITVRTTTLTAILRALPIPLTAIRLLVKIGVEGHELAILRGAMEALPELGNFAALVEILHLAPDDLAWIEAQFDLWCSELATGTLRLVPPGDLRALLLSRDVYPQDVVLCRRGLWPPGLTGHGSLSH